MFKCFKVDILKIFLMQYFLKFNGREIDKIFNFLRFEIHEI